MAVERLSAVVFWAIVLVGASACGREPGISTLTSPTPLPPTTNPSPAVTFLMIDATSIGMGTRAGLTVGASHRLVARGSTASGFVEVAPVWRVDQPQILTVDALGRISGHTNGWATVFAAYQGASAALAVRVATDFGGAWLGTWRRVRCDAPAREVCDQAFPAGSQRLLILTITMDRTRALPRLTWDLDGTPVNMTPSVEVGDDGALSLGGRFYDARGFEVPLFAVSWRSELTGPDSLNTRLTLIHGLTDGVRTEWEAVGATRRRN